MRGPRRASSVTALGLPLGRVRRLVACGRCYGGEVAGPGVAPAEVSQRDAGEFRDQFVGQLSGRQRRDDSGQSRRPLGLATVEDLVYILRHTERGAPSPAAVSASWRPHIPSQAVPNFFTVPEPLTPDCAAFGLDEAPNGIQVLDGDEESEGVRGRARH